MEKSMSNPGRAAIASFGSGARLLPDFGAAPVARCAAPSNWARSGTVTGFMRG
jgi:hypothetical protein